MNKKTSKNKPERTFTGDLQKSRAKIKPKNLDKSKEVKARDLSKNHKVKSRIKEKVKPGNKEKMKNITVRDIPENLWLKARAKAILEGKSASQLLIELIENYIKKGR